MKTLTTQVRKQGLEMFLEPAGSDLGGTVYTAQERYEQE